MLADAEPEVAVGRLVALHRVIGDRHAGNLDDARLDRVDQREVGDDPGEERPLGVARASEEERRGRQVVDRLDADLGFDGLDARDPDPGLFLALLGLLAIVAGECFGFGGLGLAAVAVVGLVVDDDDVLLGARARGRRGGPSGRGIR